MVTQSCAILSIGVWWTNILAITIFRLHTTKSLLFQGERCSQYLDFGCHSANLQLQSLWHKTGFKNDRYRSAQIHSVGINGLGNRQCECSIPWIRYASSRLMMPGHLLEVDHRGDDSRQSHLAVRSGLFAWFVVWSTIYVVD